MKRRTYIAHLKLEVTMTFVEPTEADAVATAWALIADRNHPWQTQKAEVFVSRVYRDEEGDEL